MRVWWDVASSASDAFFIVKLSPFLYPDGWSLCSSLTLFSVKDYHVLLFMILWAQPPAQQNSSDMGQMNVFCLRSDFIAGTAAVCIVSLETIMMQSAHTVFLSNHQNLEDSATFPWSDILHTPEGRGAHNGQVCHRPCTYIITNLPVLRRN